MIGDILFIALLIGYFYLGKDYGYRLAKKESHLPSPASTSPTAKTGEKGGEK